MMRRHQDTTERDRVAGERDARTLGLRGRQPQVPLRSRFKLSRHWWIMNI
jgi:hypothetical protein